MRLVYVFPEPLPLARARGIQTAHTVAELAKLGLDVELYHVPGDGHPLRRYGIEPPAGLRLIPLSRALLPPFARPHSNAYFVSRFLRAAGGGLAEAIVMARHAKVAARLLERLPSLRLVYEAHEVFADTASGDKSAARHSEEALVMRGAAAVVCNSRATADRLVERYGPARRPQVIPNGVDRPDALPEKDWAHAGRHVVYVGSFFPWKGVGELVEAASLLPGCRIELVGGEAERLAELRAKVSSGGGAELALSGQVDHTTALSRLVPACIAVLPNRAGADSAFTSPIKLFEYMAAGCAIVASDLPAIREILADDEAQWASPGDAHSLAAAIRSLADDPGRARALGERVREKSRDFTWSARAAKLKRVFEGIAQGRA